MNHKTTSSPNTFRTLPLFLFTLLLLSSPAYAYPVEGNHPQPVHMHPKKVFLLIVIDAVTAQPLAGATVEVGLRAAHTNKRGKLSLQLRYPAPTIHISATGYLPDSHVYLGERSATILLRPRTLSGTVRDATTGRYLPNVFVYGERGRFVQTNDRGIFQLPDVDAATILTVRAAGYRKQTLRRGSMAIANVLLQPFVVKGVYIPFGLLSSSRRIKEILDMVQQTELNSVVVDIKGDRGRLAYASQIPLARKIGAPKVGAVDARALVRDAHRRGIYIVARIVVFKDEPLAAAHPEWATKRAGGTLWRDRENLAWGNPFRKEVQDYNIAIAKEVAGLGFDEIQFDYVRFPSDGDIHNIAYEEKNTADTRRATIQLFMSHMQETLRPYPVFISVDVFGLVPWVKGEMGIGQEMENIAPYVDYLCPMVYPSTFAPGSMGFENPSLHPYDVVFRSVVQARSRTTTLIRPWLQHYSLYGVTYGRAELLTQREAAEKAGGWGWTYWNAGGKYDTSLFAVQP